MSNLQDRQALRKALREQRNALTANQQQHASQAVLDNLLSLPAITRATSIACYLPNDGEVDLTSFINTCWKLPPGDKKITTLPVLHPVCKGHLLFLQYNDSTLMRANKYGIEEPALACNQVVPTPHHHVVLMPLVGFDSSGNRLGMGGGYYDRTLSHIHSRKARPQLIGIAHDCQQVDQLPVQAWDIPVDAIITPTQQLIFSHR